MVAGRGARAGARAPPWAGSAARACVHARTRDTNTNEQQIITDAARDPRRSLVAIYNN